MITHEQINHYKEQGWLVMPDLFGPGEIAELKKETADIFRGKRGKVDGLMPGTGDISDSDILKQYVAIHFPHKLSPVIYKTLFHSGVVDALRGIIGENIKAMQSMLFVKAPGKAGQSWHQDEYYIPTRDKSLAGVWIAIDDATIENGCLWIIPGSHKTGYMMKRVANASNEYADVDTIDVSKYSEKEMLPVEVKSGSVVFFNGYTLHSSRRNKTPDHFRMALVNHYMCAESMLPWDQDGKLEPTEDLRDIVLIAGEDPYGWKGIVNLTMPYLRPETLNIKTRV